MKPAPFDYVAPATVPEALGLLADEIRDVKVMAGGQSLIPMLNMRLARPEVLVDITRIPELGELVVDADGRLHVSAAVRQAWVADAHAVREGWPLLAEAIRHIGHPQIRNRGTVCGSMVHHDPAAELPAAAVALDAEFVILGPSGRRAVAAEEFFLSTFQTAVEPNELLAEVVFPPVRGDGCAFAELARRHGDFASIGVAVRITRRADRVDSARIVFCGAGDKPVRVVAAEQELVRGGIGPESIEAARDQAMTTVDPPGDIHASEEYRREAAGVLVVRAITEAWERCDEG